MKKLIDRFIEWLYVKRFPDRAKKFPLPDLIRVNMKTYSPINLYSTLRVDRYMENIPPDVLRHELLKKLEDTLLQYMEIRSYKDPITDSTEYKARLTVLNKEAEHEN